MKTPWTPGPWKVRELAGDSAIDGERCVGVVYGSRDEEPRANAALIAAAPDLAEALVKLLAVTFVNPDDAAIMDAADAARAALRKAGAL